MHIDGLGTFLELEAVLRKGQTEAGGKTIAESLMAEFGIKKENLIPEAMSICRIQPTCSERKNLAG